jgi:uncharacterized membrane protein
MAGWGEYGAAWLAFVLSHMLPARPALRRPLVARLGEGGYLALYTLASLAVLGWLIGAAGRAPSLPLWGWAPWQAWVPNLALPLACVLLGLGVAIPNPFSIGGAGTGAYHPARAGVLRLTRHPVLWALVLWAGAHLPPNGDLAHALLFGGFALVGLLGMRALDGRRRRAWGEAVWAARQPRAAGLRGPALLARLAAGLALWAALLAAHAAVIGVSPLPR